MPSNRAEASHRRARAVPRTLGRNVEFYYSRAAQPTRSPRNEFLEYLRIKSTRLFTSVSEGLRPSRNDSKRLKLLLRPRFNALPSLGSSLDSMHNERTHHVMLFVLEDVAVPHVLVTASPWAFRNGGHIRRVGWKPELRDYGSQFDRVHTHGLFPTALLRRGWNRMTDRVRRAIVSFRDPLA
jgi:hypothetical protein